VSADEYVQADRWVGPDGSEHFTLPGEQPGQEGVEALAERVEALAEQLEERTEAMSEYDYGGQPDFVDPADFDSAEEYEDAAGWTAQDLARAQAEEQAAAEAVEQQRSIIRLGEVFEAATGDLREQTPGLDLVGASQAGLELMQNRGWLADHGVSLKEDGSILYHNRELTESDAEALYRAAFRDGAGAVSVGTAENEEQALERYLTRRTLGF
jgi:hypothetical protein